MMRVYFAHPMSDYGTAWQESALRAIRARQEFEAWEILNPDRPDFENGYRRYGMQFFIERCGECDAVVAAPFPDGNFGAGVGKEVMSFVMRRRPTFVMDRASLSIEFGIVGPVLTVEQTRRWLAHYSKHQ